MPVYKYRSVEAMPDDTWLERGSPELFRAIRATWEFAQRTTSPSFPPGVYKHRSVEEAERQREIWEKKNLEAHRRRIRTTGSRGRPGRGEKQSSGDTG